jgi:hypothetical protein
VSVRDPRDAMLSLYHFFENWFFEAGTISVDDFARQRYFRRGEDRAEGNDYWSHFNSWWAVRDDPAVLLLGYEHMKRDLPGTVRRVARFIGIELDDALFDIVERQSSLAFMLAHKDRFDDRLMRDRSEAVLALPPGSDSAKVRSGRVGSHAGELSPELAQAFDRIWEETVTPVHGLASYADALEALA